jgi:hypothetical protein
MIAGLKGSGFRPPTPSAWARLVRRTRQLFPLGYSVRVTRGPRPSWCDPTWEAGSYVYYDGKGKPTRGLVWIDPRAARSAAVDALHHEWAHLLTQEHPRPSEFVHDDRFWTTYGELYRAWHREK